MPRHPRHFRIPLNRAPGLLLLALFQGCSAAPIPLSLGLRYRYLSELRQGNRPHLEDEHRLELIAEMRPASRTLLDGARAFSSFSDASSVLAAGSDHACAICDESFIERLYEEWLLRYRPENEEDGDAPSLDGFERMLEEGALDPELELLIEELLEHEAQTPDVPSSLEEDEWEEPDVDWKAAAEEASGTFTDASRPIDEAGE